MRQIKEVLRLRFEHRLSVRQIARSCALPVSTVGDYLKRAVAAGLGWPLSEELTEEQLRERLMGTEARPEPPQPVRPLPEWSQVRQELGRKGVTLRLLWEEYRRSNPEGYAYSRFCELYRGWAARLDPPLRQVHPPGERTFVDWSGPKIRIQNPDTGQISEASLFVAVLGASNLTYAEAFPNEKLCSWIAAHVHAFNFFGGVSKSLIPDNPKTAVTRPCRYEPILHTSYQEMAAHYGTLILPARPIRPRDKAKAEAAVQLAQRSILAALRDQTFFCLAALNQAIATGLEQLNERPFQKLEGSRRSCFEAEEKAHLLPLPQEPYRLATWSTAKVNIDYHVVVDKHLYSVPYELIHQRVEVRLTDTTVELFHQSRRVAAHVRSERPGLFTTRPEHRPKSHQRHLEWTPTRIVDWARKIGPWCAQLVERIMAERPHPEHGFRACLGIIRLGKGVGEERLEAAARRALHFGALSYRSVKSILEQGLESQPLQEELLPPSPRHDNVRGQDYYRESDNSDSE